MEAYRVAMHALASVNEAVAVGALTEKVAAPVVKALEAKATELRADLITEVVERRPEVLQALLDATDPVQVRAEAVTAARAEV